MGRRCNSVEINGDRVKKLLALRHITISDLAKRIGYARSGVSTSINANRMDIMMLSAIACYLNCNIDYLQGATSTPTIEAERNKRPFSAKRFRYAKKRAGITHKQIQEASGVSESTYFMDFRKNYNTTGSHLEWVAIVLDVAVCYLKGEQLVHITEKPYKFKEWDATNRIDPDGYYIPPYDWINPNDRAWLAQMYATLKAQLERVKEAEKEYDNYCKATKHQEVTK